jgi:hypothetical protein
VNDLQAKLRIIAENAQALRAIKQVGQEVANTSRVIEKAPLAAGFDRAAAAADRAAAAAERAAQRSKAATERAGRDAVAASDRAAAREKASAERKARDEAALLQRREAAAARAAAREEALTKRRASNEVRKVQGIAPQITDIVTSLQGGQNPITVLLQQGGQLRDMFGGFRPLFGALAQIFTPVRIAAGGLLGVIGAIGYAIVQGALESDKLKKAFALTGNVAQYSAQQITDQSEAISANAQVSIGAAREIVTAIASSGDFSSSAGASVARAVAVMSRVSDEAAAGLQKNFADMARDASKGAVELNRQYNFLTVEQYKLVKSLEAQGRGQEAVKLVADALADTLRQRSIPAIGTLETAWNSVQGSLSSVWEWMKSIGREETAEERIRGLAKGLRDLQAARDAQLADPNLTNVDTSAVDNEIAREEARVAPLVAAATRELNSKKLRDSENAIAQKVANDQIEKLGKDHQAALASIAEAGAALTLAKTLKSIEKRASAVELDNARGLLSERAYNERMNAFEGERLEEQKRNIQARIGVASKDLVKGGDTAEQKAIRGRLTQLNASLVDAETNIARAKARGATDDARLTLEEKRKDSQDYATLEQRTKDLVRGFARETLALSAKRDAVPAARAAAEAKLATDEAQRDIQVLVTELQREINDTSIEPVKAALRAKLEELRAGSTDVVAERTRAATFDSLQRQAAALQDVIAGEEALIGARRDAGAITATEAERQLLDLRKQQVPQLREILDLMGKVAATDEEKSAVRSTQARTIALADFRTELDKSVQSAGQSQLVQFLDSLGDKSTTVGQKLKDMVSGFAKALLNLLNQRIAEKLMKTFLDAMDKIQSSGSGSGGGTDYLGLVFKFIGSLSGSGGGSSGKASIGSAGGGTKLALAYGGGRTGGLVSGKAGVASYGSSDAATRGSVVVGDINVSVPAGQGQGAGDRSGADLGKMIRARVLETINEWSTNERRPGGSMYGRA